MRFKIEIIAEDDSITEEDLGKKLSVVEMSGIDLTLMFCDEKTMWVTALSAVILNMPAKVFLVTMGTCSDYQVVAAFSTNKLAEKFRATFREGDDARIEVFDLDLAGYMNK